MPQTDTSQVAPAARSERATKPDRRSLRSRRALRRALEDELAEGEDMSQLNVASLTDRAGLTRRTFYSHYRDIPDFIDNVESELLDDIRDLIGAVGAATLPEVYRNISDLEPAPGSVELLRYMADNRRLIGSLLGPGGDPAFIQKIVDIARAEVSDRMQAGIFPLALGSFFDYYLAYVVSAEVGVVRRWFENGLAESPETMARVMTVIAFVRPGDLYGMPIDINVPEYGMKLWNLKLEEDTRPIGPARGR